MLDNLFLVPSLHCNTSLHFTLLHLSTLHFLSFTLHFLSFSLHYPLIWLNPLTFPIVLFPLPLLNQTQYGYHIPKLIPKIMNPFTALKNLSPFHFTFLFFHFHLSYQPFTSLHFILLFTSTTLFSSLHFPSLFTFYRLHFPHCFTLS